MNRTRISLAPAFALLIAVAPCLAQAVARVNSVEISHAADHGRIVFESNQPIRFSLYALRNPERLVLDLEGVEPRGVLAAASVFVEADHPQIKKMRFTRLGTQAVRMELDLKAEAQPLITLLKPDANQGYRLELRIYPAHASPRTPDGHPAPDSRPGEEVWLAMRINDEQTIEPALLLQRSDGRLLASEEDLRRRRLRLPDVEPLTYEGQRYYPLDSLRGLSYEIDEPNQTLIAQAPPPLFDTTVLQARGSGFVEPQPSPLGGFLNYDLFMDRIDRETRTSGLLEFGAFGRWGVGVASFLARERSLAGEPGSVRLDTTWTTDLPDRLASFRFGDSITGAGSWGRPVRFGGIQWARNFATQPGFVSFPLIGISGEAAIPSTVDLYVNDALRLRREVPSGPFSIQDLPIVTGQGEARLVVRDALGRERVITQPYYASPRLLREGLHDFSYELGVVRENFGIESNDYGRSLGVGTHRFGLSEEFTGEVHGEILPHQGTFGMGAVVLLPSVGVLNASVAGSSGPEGSGRLGLVGFERQTRRFSFGGSRQSSSERFVQLGLQPGESAPSSITRAFFSIGRRSGSFGLAYTSQEFRDREDLRFLNASYGMSIGRLGFLGVSVVRFLGGQSDSAASVTLTIPLDPRTSASATYISQGNTRDSMLQVQRSLPAGTGVGYRLLAAAGDSPDRAEAGVSLQSDFGTYTLEAARTRAQTGLRASVSGGLAMLGDEAFFSRRINESFAVVEVPDYPGVRVYADNQIVARTDDEGKALVPRLRPYERNAIRIEESDLPLEAQVHSVQESAIPYFRSGMWLQFAVRRSEGATVTVVLESQQFLPAGAMVRLSGRSEAFPVGLRGQVYITGLAPTNQLQAEWEGKQCQFDLAYPQTDDPLPDLGTHVCRPINQ